MTDMDAWISLRWDKAAGERPRYYFAHLHQDLWGGWVLTRAWGGRGTTLGRTVHTSLQSREAGIQALEQIRKLRQRRGYTLTESIP